MDFAMNTERETYDLAELNQENVLLDIVKEMCSGSDNTLSPKLKGKVSSIVADCDLKHYASLQKVSNVDVSTSSLLGFMHETSTKLTYDEQMELNQAFIQIIERKLPTCTTQLERLKETSGTFAKLREEQEKEIKERDKKLDTLQEQENEQFDLMMGWLNHRLKGLSTFGDNSSELLSLKVKISHLKSKILHLQLLQNIFTETNQSLKAYSEIHKDLKESIQETEKRIQEYKKTIESDIL